MVQWLGIPLATQVPSLVRELGSHMLLGNYGAHDFCSLCSATTEACAVQLGALVPQEKFLHHSEEPVQSKEALLLPSFNS